MGLISNYKYYVVGKIENDWFYVGNSQIEDEQYSLYVCILSHII